MKKLQRININFNTIKAVLDIIKICAFTGQKYTSDDEIVSACDCECHKKGVLMLHEYPCCENGKRITLRRNYIKKSRE